MENNDKVVTPELVGTASRANEGDKTSKTPDSAKPYLIIARTIFGSICWAYFIIKIFVFDVDVFIVDKLFPGQLWLLNYKFLFIVGVVSYLWLRSTTGAMVMLFSYIAFFPLIVLFWKIPRFLFRSGSWNLAFTVVNALAAAYKSLKYNFITSTLFLISFVVIMTTANSALIVFSGVMLFCLIVLAYIRRFVFAFRPSTMHQVFMHSFAGLRKHGRSTFGIEDSIKVLQVHDLTSTQLATRTQNLQFAVLFNRSCLFVAKKLRDYERTGIQTISYVLMILFLMLQTVVSFAGINYGIYKLNPENFQTAGAPSVFAFFYYSFNNLIFSSTSLIANTPTSQIVYMMQTSLVFALGAIFISIIFSEMRQRHAQDLQTAIEGIEVEGKMMESFICTEYKFNSVDEAIVELERLKSGMASFIIKVSQSLEE